MSCYFRHLKDIFDAAGIEVTGENKKAVDAAVHALLGTVYKDCMSTWRTFKEKVGTDEKARSAFARTLAQHLQT